MPEKQTTERARKAMRSGKKPSTAAGEFVREEIHHVREGKHGARSRRQAVAIGLSKARRAGIPLRPQGQAKSRATSRSSSTTSSSRGGRSAAGRTTASKTRKKKPTPSRSTSARRTNGRTTRKAPTRRRTHKSTTPRRRTTRKRTR